jgi:hypothetical protein
VVCSPIPESLPAIASVVPPSFVSFSPALSPFKLRLLSRCQALAFTKVHKGGLAVATVARGHGFAIRCACHTQLRVNHSCVPYCCAYCSRGSGPM